MAAPIRELPLAYRSVPEAASVSFDRLNANSELVRSSPCN
jgi:hypothetical protein